MIILIRTFSKVIQLLIIIFLISPHKVLSQTELPGDIIMRPVLGVQKMLFIRVKYPDDNTVVLSDQRAPNHADELNAIIEANSYGKLRLDIDITPILTMPQPTSFYKLEDRKSLIKIRADAIKIAEDAGFNINDYDREAIFTIRLWPQKAFRGIGGVNIRTIFTSFDKASHSAHELGHTFDWRHANFWRVTSNNPIDTAGVLIQYGDKFDIMGDVHHPHHYNPWFKFRVGWLPIENILTVSESGTYIIRALEKSPVNGTDVSEYSALKIRRSPDSEYWIYYRSQEDSANVGAMISLVQPQNISQALLLDMTPGSKPEKSDYKDAALVPGKTIRDQEAGIEITVIEKNNDSLLVQINVLQKQIDTLPVINIVNPLPGKTVHGTIDYEATAFDPDVGTVNGAGIDTVKFRLGYLQGDDPWGEGLTFIKIAGKFFTSPPYVFQVNTDSIPDEAYRLYVEAVSQNGGSNKVSLSHLVDNTGPSIQTSVIKEQVKDSFTFQLQQNYPNPFNPSTTINYIIAHDGKVELRIYDLLGKIVSNLVNENKQVGQYSILWDGRDDAGMQVTTGTYFYEIRIGEFKSAKMMMLLK